MSVKPSRLKVVLCWHMHQPHYFDQESGQYQLPWTYLHAIKDYVDMAAIIEAVPGARAVVNFAPTLLEQLDDYAAQVRNYLTRGKPLKDPLLATLATVSLPTEPQRRYALVKACLRAHRKRLIERFEPYRVLADLAPLLTAQPRLLHYLDDRYLIDLVVWYHLAWLGETVRRGDPRVAALMEKGGDYSRHDRYELLQIIGELLEGVVPRYRALAEAGRIELSTTPYAHPIVPLLLDFAAAREAAPDSPLPTSGAYPGGEERARWHIREGIRVFEQHFGFRPTGCWPAEGGVSERALGLFEEAGVRWVATGESVLHNSLRASGMHKPDCIHRPYRPAAGELSCFFRDDGLSDLIGFTYSGWHGDDAVNNLVHHLENIGRACAHEPNRVVSIILDGENAWEYYPENGYYFLTALYRRLADHPRLELTTFGDCVEAGLKSLPLPRLTAGSWVYGNFSTWMGDKDKNHGWDHLVEAKRVFDAACAEGRLKGRRLQAVERQLAICEGSDWFWWFGDYNPSEAVRDFDRLYRLQLAELYRLLGVEPPESIAHVISRGGGDAESGGVMRRGKQQG